MSHVKLSQLLLLLFSLFTLNINGQRMRYIGKLKEFDKCQYYSGIDGICRRNKNCFEEFQNYRNNQSVLKVCEFGDTLLQNTICCPTMRRIPTNINEARTQFEQRIRMMSEPVQKPDMMNFKVCRSEMLQYRNYSVNPNHFGDAMYDKRIPVNKENCELLSQLNWLKEKHGGNSLDLRYFGCMRHSDGTYEVYVVAAMYAELVERGNRPNMAAIGWTQFNGSVLFNCGGSVVTERFIVTAAHCKYFNGAQADLVRIGDRFLLTTEDDDIAQELKILRFISHPNYRSRYVYNDIAMIKTVGKIFFNQFVVPACIDSLDSERVGFFTDWTVAGYGETEDRIPSNVLLELKVNLVSNKECNKTYRHDRKLPRGILDSQFCVKSQDLYNEYPDTCFGDSGSPLQFQTWHEVFHDDFNQSLLSSVYKTSTVLGIVSFGLDCGFKVPSVYTRLSYYRDWMRSVIKFQ